MAPGPQAGATHTDRSVKPDNVKGLMTLPDVDGALVGSASLKADSFLKLVHYDKQ